MRELGTSGLLGEPAGTTWTLCTICRAAGWTQTRRWREVYSSQARCELMQLAAQLAIQSHEDGQHVRHNRCKQTAPQFTGVYEARQRLQLTAGAGCLYDSSCGV
jgi:hypothetical protein